MAIKLSNPSGFGQVNKPPPGFFDMEQNYFTPSAGHGAGPQTYDLSGLKKGWEELSAAPGYKATGSYTPFKFNTPKAATVGPFPEISDSMYDELFNKSLGAGSRAIRSQGEERMRMAGQGFGGGRLTGPALSSMKMQNAQKTGDSVQDLASGLSSDVAKARLTEKSNANRLSFEDVQRVRDMNFNAEMETQKMQAEENYKGFGYGDQQSKWMSDDAFKKAQLMLQYGMALPQFQQSAFQTNSNQYNQFLSGLGGMGGIGAGG